jgi:hypothetical protein
MFSVLVISHSTCTTYIPQALKHGVILLLMFLLKTLHAFLYIKFIMYQPQL